MKEHVNKDTDFGKKQRYIRSRNRSRVVNVTSYTLDRQIETFVFLKI